MGNSDSKAAENYASVVNSSLIQIVNDVAMECQSDVAQRNRIVISTTYNNVEDVKQEWNINQSALASVNSSCLQNSEVYNVASSTILNDIEQTAKAVQAGFIPPPSVANTTEVVNNVSQQILNTYQSECISKFEQENTLVFQLNIQDSSRLEFRYNINQDNTADFVHDCVMQNIQSTDAYTEMTNIISQTAETESKSALFAIIVFMMMLCVLMIVVNIVGPSELAEFIFYTGLSTIGVVLLAGIVISGFAVLFMWLFGFGLFSKMRDEEEYTQFDQFGTYDNSSGKYVCNGTTGKNIDGFLNCVDPKFPDNSFMSFWCPNDLQNFDNFRVDFEYFWGTKQPQNEDLSNENKVILSRLSPEFFRGVNVKHWPVDTFVLKEDSSDTTGRLIGMWPINARYTVAPNQPVTRENAAFLQYYNPAWESIIASDNADGFWEMYPSPSSLYAYAQANQLTFGVCVPEGSDYAPGVDYEFSSMNLQTQAHTPSQTRDNYVFDTFTDDKTGAEVTYNLSEGTTTKYPWEQIYAGFIQWYTQFQEDELVYVYGGEMPGLTENDADEWFDIFDHEDTQKDIFHYDTYLFQLGEVLGEAIYMVRTTEINNSFSTSTEKPVNQSPYNKAWVGKYGTLLADEFIARNVANWATSNRGGGIQTPSWTHNDRGYICFTRNDTFELDNGDRGTITISALDSNFISERAPKTRQCLRSSNLASKSGRSVYNWGCLDYIQDVAWSTMKEVKANQASTYSACCKWSYGVKGCEDYSSAYGPFRCDTSNVFPKSVQQYFREGYENGSCSANTKGTDAQNCGSDWGGCENDGVSTEKGITTQGLKAFNEPIDVDPDMDVMDKLASIAPLIDSYDQNPSNLEYCDDTDKPWKCQTIGFVENTSGTFCCTNRAFKYRESSVPKYWTDMTTPASGVLNDPNGKESVCLPQMSNTSNPNGTTTTAAQWQSIYLQDTALCQSDCRTSDAKETGFNNNAGGLGVDCIEFCSGLPACYDGYVQ